MKYKILLTGNNKPLIDDLFAKLGGSFEFQCTSARYEDIMCHIKYFQPNGFLYCINHEMPETFRRMADLKKTPEAVKTAFFAIGTRAECDAYMRMAPETVDLVLEKPITLNAMEEKILTYFLSLEADPASSNSTPPIPIPVKMQQTVDTMVQSISQAWNAADAQPTAPPAANPAPAAKQANPSSGQAQAPVQQPLSGQAPRAAAPQPSGQTQIPGAQFSGQTQAPGAQPSGQTQAPGAQPSKQTQAPGTQPSSSRPGNKPETPAGNAKPANTKNMPEDEQDALLLALTAQIGEASKVLDTVNDLDLDLDMEEAVDTPHSNRKHILVVDDDSRMLKIIKRHLADKYDVATALNGRIAMKFLENKKTDLILLDYEMPLESGPAVLKRLRDNPSTHDIPVIFLTGISERDKIEKALALKPQGYLLKPIDHIKLLSTISKLVN